MSVEGGVLAGMEKRQYALGFFSSVSPSTRQLAA